jgi:putative ABC transport system ATP-binding protein
LGGLDYPTSGEVYIDEVKYSEMNREAMTIFRRRNIGFIFQDFNLLPLLNVYENIVLPIQLDGKKVDERLIQEITDQLGITEKLDFLPNHLSGGQQQRVAIARALATRPAIILADEPTGNLDSKTSQDVLGLLKMMGKKYNQSILLITHNEAIAQMADRTIRIEDGYLIDWRQSNV